VPKATSPRTPLVVPYVRSYLQLHMEESSLARWLQHWLDGATNTTEEMLSRDSRTGRFCYGDVPSLANICLILHMTTAQMLCGINFDAQPMVLRIFIEGMKVGAFAAAHRR
jgi:hypothetical protein